MQTYQLKDGTRFQATDARDLFRQMHEGSLWARGETLDEYIVGVAQRASILANQPFGLWRDEEELLAAIRGVGLIEVVEERGGGRR